ncbi:MBL fold metallo-hydrolase [Kineosporia mesophila]|uniref:MBL fold metallo-hydrolase n=1 Tax=Kineosporia mesophila TaxID=566012 RepID=A0ABP7APB9_9ACTN|nr:MBL fold metallo-hydrolase [Kineosporia mesophila]MCD5349280.1 MBL fold metallo-hydrolase [Kineosporia mesophila]
MTMVYNGEVTPGGHADVRELPDAVIRKASVSPQDNNAYLITCRQTGDQLLIDAADDAERVRALIGEGGGPLRGIVTTHQHWDHHRALPEIAEVTGAPTLAGEDDADELPVKPDVRLRHADVVTVGELTLDVVHLRGHTPGSVTLVLTSSDGSVHAFTGDSLFPGGPGRTTNPDEFNSLMDDLEERIFGVYPDVTWIYPGHGKDSTLGRERPAIPVWRERGW